MPKDRVLELLLNAKGEYISGEYISEQLSVSRAAVCKDIKSIKDMGYTVEAVTNRGYRLVSECETLSLPSLKSIVAENYQDRIVILDSIDSTNTYAKHMAMEGAPSGTIIIAREQTGGRGRRGKNFSSVKDVGLYLSAILRPDVLPTDAVTLTAYAAVAMRNAIEKCCGIAPEIKWINDLVMNKKKIAGILTEMSIEGESGKVDYIVLGIGINALQEQNSFPDEIQEIATSIYAATGKKLSLNSLAASVINELDDMLDAWKTKRPDYYETFSSSCISLKAPLLVGAEKRPAKAIGLDKEYGLIVEFEDGSTATQSAGEVSVVGYCGF